MSAFAMCPQFRASFLRDSRGCPTHGCRDKEKSNSEIGDTIPSDLVNEVETYPWRLNKVKISDE